MKKIRIRPKNINKAQFDNIGPQIVIGPNSNDQRYLI